MRKKVVLKKYSRECIEKLTEHIRGNSDAFNWLVNNGYMELVAMHDAVRGDRKAFDFLINNKFYILAAFVNSVWEDSKAFQFLMDNKAYDWAACANIINGDEKAQEILLKLKKTHWVNLALQIQRRIQEDGDKNVSPWGVLQNLFNFRKYD